MDQRRRTGPDRGRAATAAALLASLLGLAADPATARCVDTALVFAFDASGSIGPEEYRLQVDGLGRALRDPEVIRALERPGGVALAAVVWSDAAVGTRTVGWRTVTGAAAAGRFAEAVAALPRIGTGNTDIGAGLWTALDVLEAADAPCANRRVVDVSGDGPETVTPRRHGGASVLAARRRADALGVTVNGLAVVDDDPDLPRYYREQVATGPDAFVVVAEGFDDFVRAMRTKLIRELGGLAVASAAPDGAGSP